MRYFLVAGFVLGFILYGCDDGRVGPTRLACEISTGSDGVRRGWFAYTNSLGDVIDQPGVRFDIYGGDSGTALYSNGLGGYYSEYTDGIWVEDSGVTGDDGYLRCTGGRNWDELRNTYCNTNRVYSKPNVDVGAPGDCSAMFTYRTTSPAVQVAFANGVQSIPDYITDPAIVAQINSNENLLASECMAVTSENPTLPSSGFDSTVALVQQRGLVGAGVYVTGVSDEFMATNLVTEAQVFLWSAPMMYSFTVTTADSKDLSEMTFMGSVKTDAEPGGVTVLIKEVASNEEDTVHVLRTEYFLLQDDNFYNELTCGFEPNEVPVMSVYDRWTPIAGVDMEDPNTVEGTPLDIYDPNFVMDGLYDPNRVCPVKIIPIQGEGDFVEIDNIRVVTDMSLVSCISEGWLTDDKTLDMFPDGIVNLKDWIMD
jgi:hypothetical protein